MIQNSTALVMSAQARRLQALSGQSLIGTLPIQPLLDIVEDITGIVIMVVGQFADLAAHVVWSVLHEIAVIVYNMIMTLVRVLSALVMQIFSLGIVQNLLRIGFDILMVLLIHVGLPLLTAALDLVLCLVNFIMPGTWPKQLECIEQTCFQEDGDIGAEIFTTFSSIPVAAKQAVKVVEALINPATGRRFGQSANGGADEEVVGEDINPGNVGSPGATSCAACFTCRIPELRALWLLVAMTWGCVNDQERFAGRVENSCLDGGSWYLEACGPRTSF